MAAAICLPVEYTALLQCLIIAVKIEEIPPARALPCEDIPPKESIE